MITVLDPVLVNDGGGSILQALEGLGAQYEVKSLPVASSVGWMREKIQYNVGSGVQVAIFEHQCFYPCNNNVLPIIINIWIPELAKID